jgi:hypothetical protein
MEPEGSLSSHIRLDLPSGMNSFPCETFIYSVNQIAKAIRRVIKLLQFISVLHMFRLIIPSAGTSRAGTKWEGPSRATALGAHLQKALRRHRNIPKYGGG